MNNNSAKLLLGLCLVLLFIVLIEWLWMDSFEQAVNQAQASSQKQQKQIMTLPQLQLAGQAIDSYSSMINKPLFIAGRKPVIENEVEVSQEVSKIDDITLIGIYSIKDHFYAMFSQQNGDQKYLKKLLDDDVSGWLLKEIKVDSVILERAGKQQTLLLRKAKPKTAMQLKANTRLEKRKAKSLGKPERRKPKSNKRNRRKARQKKQHDDE